MALEVPTLSRAQRLLASSAVLQRSSARRPQMVRCRASAASNISENVCLKSTSEAESQTNASRYLPIYAQQGATTAMATRTLLPIDQILRTADPKHITASHTTNSKARATVAELPKRITASTILASLPTVTVLMMRHGSQIAASVNPVKAEACHHPTIPMIAFTA